MKTLKKAVPACHEHVEHGVSVSDERATGGLVTIVQARTKAQGTA